MIRVIHDLICMHHKHITTGWRSFSSFFFFKKRKLRYIVTFWLINFGGMILSVFICSVIVKDNLLLLWLLGIHLACCFDKWLFICVNSWRLVAGSICLLSLHYIWLWKRGDWTAFYCWFWILNVVWDNCWISSWQTVSFYFGFCCDLFYFMDEISCLNTKIPSCV